MGIGSGWSSSPWGGSLIETESVPGQLYDVDLGTDPVNLSDSGFVNPPTPTFMAGAEGPMKVGVVFSLPMSAAALTSTNYTLVEIEGGANVPLDSVQYAGSGSAYKVDLLVSRPLHTKEFYALKLGALIVSTDGIAPLETTYIFQWADMTTALKGRPLEIPIQNFSGEVTGGILGNPDGLVFFSPAYEPVVDTSTIEVAEVSVCTKAFDEYHLPDIPDPTDDDNSAVGTLVEPIDITRAGFLNDGRWRTYPPGVGQTTFTTASNLTSIGPGPTDSFTLEPA